jgi:single-stranded-DNA-specific exonuclease
MPELLVSDPLAGAALAPREPIPRRIDVTGYDLAAALELERELGVSHALAQVLVRRGYNEPVAALALLEPTERHEPLAFSGMGGALELIERHVADGNRITVHGDYDVDGVCATAVLVRALRSLGADVGWYLPSRSDDGYGLAASTVERLVNGPTKLLITVDCGITAVEQVAAARAGGLDVVITDHHSPRADGQLPDCRIVHPAVGGYPFPMLCGTAVAHKLAEALGATTVDDDLELVALATVADLVPLQGENRRLVREGLRKLAGTRLPGLRALMAVSRTDPGALDATALGFRLAPRMNAAGRLRRADAALELLLTEDDTRAGEIARELDQVNADRRAVEQRITWEAEAIALEMGERPVYVLAGAGWHAGVVGIVASRIVERFNRPAIVIALDEDDPLGPAHGSARSIPGFDLLAAITSGAEHLITYGGHRAAAGLTILPENLDAFRALVETHAEATLTAELLTPVERVDAVVSAGELTLQLAEELQRLEPCGLGNPAATVLVPGARFESVRPMADGKHARFNVASGSSIATAVAFGCDGKVPCADGTPVNATFRLERNAWQGRLEPRLVLRHAQPVKPPPIELLNKFASVQYLDAVLDQMGRELVEELGGGGSLNRVVLDRRGESPLAVLTDAISAGTGQPASTGNVGVLAVCADVPRRLEALQARVGGFALTSHSELADAPGMADRYEQIVVLDPPMTAAAERAVRSGAGYTQLAWGAAELRFAEQIHELEYGLRTSLVTLYRALRERQRVAGEELEQLLRGDGQHARSARLAGRLLRVLTELELVSLSRDPPALALAGAQPTELERSAAYRAYTKTYEDGQQFLKRAKLPQTA